MGVMPDGSRKDHLSGLVLGETYIIDFIFSLSSSLPPSLKIKGGSVLYWLTVEVFNTESKRLTKFTYNDLQIITKCPDYLTAHAGAGYYSPQSASGNFTKNIPGKFDIDIKINNIYAPLGSTLPVDLKLKNLNRKQQITYVAFELIQTTRATGFTGYSDIITTNKIGHTFNVIGKGSGKELGAGDDLDLTVLFSLPSMSQAKKKKRALPPVMRWSSDSVFVEYHLHTIVRYSGFRLGSRMEPYRVELRLLPAQNTSKEKNVDTLEDIYLSTFESEDGTKSESLLTQLPLVGFSEVCSWVLGREYDDERLKAKREEKSGTVQLKVGKGAISKSGRKQTLHSMEFTEASSGNGTSEEEEEESERWD
eukprot:TRINITY_DN3911_c0_g3_i1.p1 TRINITY_DN3911_c0_g3~~TRINITY_DN3911_c0_g3_i1.p1  ORF type:complete len:387 (-),score=62.52 TRINITY_DN3911_c0_g3_i1:809-1900(-)